MFNEHFFHMLDYFPKIHSEIMVNVRKYWADWRNVYGTRFFSATQLTPLAPHIDILYKRSVVSTLFKIWPCTTWMPVILKIYEVWVFCCKLNWSSPKAVPGKLNKPKVQNIVSIADPSANYCKTHLLPVVKHTSEYDQKDEFFSHQLSFHATSYGPDIILYTYNIN